MSILDPRLWLAVLLLLGATNFFSYWKGERSGRQAVESRLLRDDAIARTATDAALKATAEAISKIEVKNVTIRQTLEKEIHKEPVYRDCRHTSDGLRTINNALTGSSTISASDSKLPGTDATK